MPVLFVGHGSPMNAIEDSVYSRAWTAMGAALPRPRAILCISAHWEMEGTRVTGMAQPRTIHDFAGFPPALFAVQYPAPGSPALAALVRATVPEADVRVDDTWGLDHGAWSVLRRMYPGAEIPVVQLSLNVALPPRAHYALGRALAPLRRRGVLILGSGNIVHNLRTIVWDDRAFDWASEFDATIRDLILARRHEEIITYPHLSEAARLSVPTNEHFLPLLYALALQEADDPVSFFAEGVTLGSISMRSLRIG